MANLNKVILIGNLTADPDSRTTPKGTAVTELRLAINRFSTDANNERREETTFVDVTCWGRTAEIAAQYLAKGRSVMIEGRLQYDTWDDKATGQKRSKLRVVAENLQLLGGAEGGSTTRSNNGAGQQRSYGNNNQGGAQRNNYNAPSSSAPASQNDFGDDDDIPF